MGDRGGETAVLVTPPNYEQTLQTELRRNTRWGTLLTVVAFATTLGAAMPVGYNIGVVNSPASYIRDWCNVTIIERYGGHFTSSQLDVLWSVVVSLFLIGAAIGSLGGAWFADRFGRKGSFLISGALFVVAAVLFQFCRDAKSIEMLLAGRFIVGLASGLTTTVIPMYLTELAPLALRGTLGVFCGMGVTGGVVVGQVFSLRNVFGTEELWQYALSSYVFFVIVCYVPSFYYPESPKYLYIIRGNKEQARIELERLRGNNQAIVNVEIEEMETHLGTKDQSCSLWSVLREPTLMLPLVIVCAFQGGQQLSGVNAVFYYSVSIFQSAGLSKIDAEWANLGAGCLNLLTSLFGPLLMSKVNRRTLMLPSCAMSAVFLFALTFVVHYIEYAHWLSIACIVCVFAYIFFYQIGLGPIPFFIGSELFDVAPRPIAMSLGSLSSWVCNFIIGMTFPSLQIAWGAFVFMPFCITCVLLFILTKLYLPETRGRDIAEISPLVSKGFKSTPLG